MPVLVLVLSWDGQSILGSRDTLIKECTVYGPSIYFPGIIRVPGYLGISRYYGVCRGACCVYVLIPVMYQDDNSISGCRDTLTLRISVIFSNNCLYTIHLNVCTLNFTQNWRMLHHSNICRSHPFSCNLRATMPHAISLATKGKLMSVYSFMYDLDLVIIVHLYYILSSVCAYNKFDSYCYFTAKDIPEKLVDEVLRKVDVQRAKILRLVPYMHRECIITNDEHQQLTNPQTTDLTRGNLLAIILMGKRVHWLLKFCHCLLQSYQSERGLDIHYTLLQQIKGDCKYAVNLCSSFNC